MPEQKDIAAGGVFNVVRVDVVGIPNNAIFFRVLRVTPRRPRTYGEISNLMESASESAKTKRLVGHRVASDKRSCGKVALTIDGKTRVLQSVGELERLNKTDKVINLPSKDKGGVQEAIYNVQLNDPTLGLVCTSSFVFFNEDRFNEYPAYSLRFLDMDKATAARAYRASEMTAYRASEMKTTKKASTKKI